jgi:selenocysteine lyase/cysteine desulfurase
LALAQDTGAVVKTFEPGQGGEDTLRNLTAGLTPRTRVVSVSHVTCTLGLVLPIKEIVTLCRERGVYSVVDGAQAVGQIPVDLHELGCDFYATSGHKWLLGPKGTGLVYVRKELLERWRAVQVGAYSDRKYDLDQGLLERLPAARAVEYGTQNTALVKALGAAVDFIAGPGMLRITQHGRRLAGYLRSALLRLPAVQILSRAEPELSASIVTFRITQPELAPGQWAERLKNDYRIRVRPVTEHGLSAVRVCTHVFNDTAQLDRLVSALAELTRT